ncbi:MAG: hypothetical protein M1828_006060 [Chrysothrix sp. TS-e1954]|nr:MAG: hypothetical protein M1828_006060 [Chrysothrix sp. TS-e1954]
MLSRVCVVLGAFAATALAEPQGINTVSALAAIESVLPQSLQNLAITNGPSASALVASEFAAGSTPAWFSKLPSNVQTYLVPVTSIGEAPGVFLSALPTQATSLISASYKAVPSMNATMPYGVNGTHNATSGVAGMGSGTAGGTGTGAIGGKKTGTGMMTTSAMMTSGGMKTSSGMGSSSTGGSGGSAGGAGGSSSSSAMGAAVAAPTGLISAGIAGAFGLVALAAL